MPTNPFEPREQVKWTLRELFLLVALVAMGLGWLRDHVYLARSIGTLVNHIYRTEGKHVRWENNGTLVFTDK